MSPSSPDILITLVLPDLETTSEDIFIYPTFPMEGESADINILVWNRGERDAEEVEADIYIWYSTGTLEQVASTIFPIIAAHDA